MNYFSTELDPFLTKEEKETIRKSNLKSDQLRSIIDMLEEDLSKQRQLLRQEGEITNKIYHKTKLLRHANCDHKWIYEDTKSSEYGSDYYQCYKYDWCKKQGSLHRHERCLLCGLVKGEPCYTC